ncbi:hypothetical protein PIB30_054288, partial [Stylosanthes scabra]|nr:hypothetical protein [Stylosanthes scabra]
MPQHGPNVAHPTPKEASKQSPKAAACHVWTTHRRGPNVTHSRTREARPDSPPVTFWLGQNVTQMWAPEASPSSASLTNSHVFWLDQT